MALSSFKRNKTKPIDISLFPLSNLHDRKAVLALSIPKAVEVEQEEVEDDFNDDEDEKEDEELVLLDEDGDGKGDSDDFELAEF